jgi:Cof subfamily protein (haloacid dehalogenase superfamily)
MIALDLDGTLAIENHQVSPKTRDALADLHSNSGVEVVIATGRRYRTTRFVIDNLGFEVFAVCNGGALVKTPEQQTLHRDTFDVAHLAELARSLNITLFAQRDAHDMGGADFVIDSESRWNDATEKYHQDNAEFSATSDLMKSPDEFLVAGVFGPESELRTLANAIAENFPEQYNTIVVPHLQTGHHYVEISQRHVDKWHGLTQLHKHLEIDPNHVCTVGDQLNDVAMISAAGHGVAMSNGHEDLQQMATFVCGHNEEDGIVDVVNYIREINAAANG